MLELSVESAWGEIAYREIALPINQASAPDADLLDF